MINNTDNLELFIQVINNLKLPEKTNLLYTQSDLDNVNRELEPLMGFLSKNLKIYSLLYNDNTIDSAFQTISLHLTEKEAEEAMRKHKEMVKKEHDDEIAILKHFDLFEESDYFIYYDLYKAWSVVEKSFG